MSQKRQLAPEGFEVLTETISIHRSDAAAEEGSPSLIVICSWMAALPKHIQKYTDQYKKLFPTSTILLIQSSWTDVAATDAKMVSRLSLAVSTIKAHTPINGSNNNNKVFLHIFSNGGATVANHLSIQLHSHFNQLLQNGNKKLFSKVILECTPSRPEVGRAVKAVAYGIPNFFLIRIIGTFLLRCYIAFGLWQCRIRGIENMVDRIRRRLNAVSSFNEQVSVPDIVRSSPAYKDGQLWDRTVPRLYLYSKSDEVVGWQDVRDHAEEARKAGYEVVKEEVFETAPHVGLPREDFARYWGIVEAWVRGENRNT